MKSDDYINEVKRYLTEICRVLSMSVDDYHKEIVEKNSDNQIYEVRDMWCFRSGSVHALAELALGELERRERKR